MTPLGNRLPEGIAYQRDPPCTYLVYLCPREHFGVFDPKHSRASVKSPRGCEPFLEDDQFTRVEQLENGFLGFPRYECHMSALVLVAARLFGSTLFYKWSPAFGNKRYCLGPHRSSFRRSGNMASYGGGKEKEPILVSPPGTPWATHGW